MNEQTALNLTRIIELLKDNQTFSTGFLDSILKTSQCPPVRGVILKLLCLLLNKLSKGGSIQSKAEELELLSEVLLSIAPIIQASTPLRYLMNRQFGEFDRYCKDGKQPQLSDLLLRSHGLYPPSSQKGLGSVFSPQSACNSKHGNPHWALARYGLTQWFIINRDNLHPSIGKVYDFLLSSDDFINHASDLTKLWDLLYCFYTQYILEDQWSQNQFQDRRYITWKRCELKWYKNQILALQSHLSGEVRVIYHLVLELLTPLQFQKDTFQNALNSCKKCHNEAGLQWEILTDTFFFKIASIKGYETLASRLRYETRQLLQSITHIDNVSAFLPFYFTIQQLLPKIIQEKINCAKLRLTTDEKSTVAFHMLQNSKINEEFLAYLSLQHFSFIFTTKKWEQQAFANKLITLMKTHSRLFQQKLNQLVSGTEGRIVASQFALFSEVWSSCHASCQQNEPNFALLQNAIDIDKNSFRQKFQFLIIPIECPGAVFKILKGYIRYFGSLKMQMKNGGPALKLFRQFQQNQLPRLISTLDKSQRDQFWKDWVDILQMDPDFVSDIILPHPSPQSFI